ncbi:MAG: site-specific DNA-methyltransferase [Anaerolineales bacterium]|nr:site-specific DNA-methyltransferase [Anaerolineales bacterium]
MTQKKKKPFATLLWKKRPLQSTPPASLRLSACYGNTFNTENPEKTYKNHSRLIHGDNLRILKALQPEYKHSIDLIYCDPPFLTGKAYTARVGRNEDSRRPDEWELALGYQDTWKDGAEYLDMLSIRLQEMYSLLSSQGTLYLHLDWHASAYARVLLDEIFGPDRLLNELVWIYHGPSPIKSAFKRKHDTILVYTKSSDYIFNADAVRVPYNPSTIKTFASSKKAGFGKKPDLKRGKVPEDWWYFPVVARLHNERTGYPTQKPLALLERIVKASTNRGSLVADFFCGSGTTAVAAELNGRRWLACDSAQLAVSTTYKRLIELDPSAFTLWNTDSSAVEPSAIKLDITLHQQLMEVQLDILLPELDTVFIQMLEVDWGFNGAVFHSADQYLLSAPTSTSEAGRITLSHTYQERSGYRIAVRITDNQGKVSVVEKDIQVV